MDIIIITGPPGSGKGTYSKALAERHGYLHVSAGDLLRARMQIDDALGRETKALMDKNVLLPDRIVTAVVEDYLKTLPDDVVVLLDGYPRLMDNYDGLIRMVSEHHWNLKLAVNIDVSEEVCMARILKRGRNDIDKDRQKVLKRFFDYRANTYPILKRFEHRGVLKHIDGDADIDTCVKRIENLLGLGDARKDPKPSINPK